MGQSSVAYDPESLATEAGSRALLAKLERAAYEACGGDPRNHAAWKNTPKLTVRAYRACQERAVAQAVTQVGSPALAAVHAGQVRTRVAR